MRKNEDTVIIIACIRGKDELNWIKNIIREYKDPWVIVDKKTAEILNRENLLAMINGNKLIVFKNSRGEEFALKIYKLAKPSRVYICDRYGILKIISELMKAAPIEVVEY